MKTKNLIIIAIVICSVIVSLVFFLSFNLEENQIQSKESKNITEEIDKIYDELEKSQEELERYVPGEREWQSSGPFQIDRKEYRLGEKIFMKAENIKFDEKGEFVFIRTLNETHFSVWKNFLYDGMKKDAFNIYFEPKVSLVQGICSKNDLIGDWHIIFPETEYIGIKFSIVDEFVPGEEAKFEPVC